MAYFVNKIKTGSLANLLTTVSIIPLYQRISVRNLKGIIAVFFLCTMAAFLFFCYPLYLQLRSLQNEKIHWQNLLSQSISKTQTQNQTQTTAKTETCIPSAENLPDMIELCRRTFVEEGVMVDALDAESFGGRPGQGNAVNIDYGLVWFRLLGKWERIVAALQDLENKQEVRVHIQEAVLDQKGGEVHLQIYFCNDNS